MRPATPEELILFPDGSRKVRIVTQKKCCRTIGYVAVGRFSSLIIRERELIHRLADATGLLVVRPVLQEEDVPSAGKWLHQREHRSLR